MCRFILFIFILAFGFHAVTTLNMSHFKSNFVCRFTLLNLQSSLRMSLIHDNYSSEFACVPQFLCEEGSGDYIARIDEPETCVYVLTVHTTKICHHPDLRPKSHSHNVPIYCNPVITDAQYEQYLIDLEGIFLGPLPKIQTCMW